jgi:hypothetical protein
MLSRMRLSMCTLEYAMLRRNDFRHGAVVDVLELLLGSLVKLASGY